MNIRVNIFISIVLHKLIRYENKNNTVWKIMYTKQFTDNFRGLTKHKYDKTDIERIIARRFIRILFNIKRRVIFNFQVRTVYVF